jgi:malate permease and related proteins
MNFFSILEIVLPVFLVITLGVVIKQSEIVDEHFLSQSSRLLYLLCMPALLFYKTSTSNFHESFNLNLVLGSLLALLLVYALTYLYGKLCHYPPEIRGTFAQGASRSNLALLGLAVIYQAYGDEGLTKASILLGFYVPVLNLISVIVLLLPHHTETRLNRKFWLREIILNPLILASFIGMIWSSLSLPLPGLVNRTLDIITSMTLPLALLVIGAGFRLHKMRIDLKKAVLAALIKIVIMPLIALGILLWLNVSGLDLSIGILLAASPTATVSYIMASQLKGDAELTASIILISTLLSCVTYSFFLVIALHVF